MVGDDAYVTLTCPICRNDFRRAIKQYNDATVRRGQTNHYCSPTCAGLASRRRISGDCKWCGQFFERRRGGKQDKGLFCSRNCAAKFIAESKLQSTAEPRSRGKAYICPLCFRSKSAQSEVCWRCKRDQRNKQTTIGDLRQNFSTHAFHAKIRGFARDLYDGPMTCAACGYDLHVDICHIRDVADFPPEATLAEVNNPTNLVALDKRCHWEFDHGYLEIKEDKFVSCIPEIPATAAA